MKEFNNYLEARAELIKSLPENFCFADDNFIDMTDKTYNIDEFDVRWEYLENDKEFNYSEEVFANPITSNGLHFIKVDDYEHDTTGSIFVFDRKNFIEYEEEY